MSCRSPVSIPFDGQMCRDNTFARLQPVAAAVPDLPERFGITEELTNCMLWNGSYTIVVKASGYNGKKNDDRVRLDYYISPGRVTPPGWECPFPGFRETYPLWLPATPFYVSDRELTGPIVKEGELPDSKQFDDNGYVRDGYVVGRFPDGTRLDLAGDFGVFPGFDTTLYKGVVSAKLERAQDGTWKATDGVVGGRIRSEI